MNSQQLGLLRFFALLFLLPGLAGLILSAWISADYQQQLPRVPIPAEQRMIPRNIHGTVVYQTDEEDRRLSTMEEASVCVFLLGLGLGLVYLRKWGIDQALSSEAEDEEEFAPSHLK